LGNGVPFGYHTGDCVAAYPSAPVARTVVWAAPLAAERRAVGRSWRVARSNRMEKTATKNVAVPPVGYVRAAGGAYLFVILIAVLNVAFVDSRLVVPGDSVATASNIIVHESLFRVGVIAVLVMYASVVVLSVSLYVVLKAVDENLARLAMLLRICEAILGGATTLFSFAALLLLTDHGLSTGIDPQHAQAFAALFLDVRTAGLDVVLFFVGLGGTAFCHLFYKSGYVPRALAGWGIFTYLSMLVLAPVSILLPEHPIVFETVLYANGTFFEVLFGAWLLFKGLDYPRQSAEA